MTHQRIPVILLALRNEGSTARFVRPGAVNGAKDLSVSSASQSNLHSSCDGRNP